MLSLTLFIVSQMLFIAEIILVRLRATCQADRAVIDLTAAWTARGLHVCLTHEVPTHVIFTFSNYLISNAFVSLKGFIFMFLVSFLLSKKCSLWDDTKQWVRF
jgi:hypothetical protein